MIPRQLIVVVSDFHAGSTVGLCPPTVKTDGGSGYTSNLIQQFLWDSWQQSLRWIREINGSDPFALVINGDCIEGRHHNTMQLIHHDYRIHKNLAIEMLKPLVADTSTVFLVRGTECHARTSEDDIGEALGAIPDPSTNDSCWEQLQLRVNGVLCHFKHHISAPARKWSQSSALAAELAGEQLAACTLGHEIPRVIVRSHRHEFNVHKGDNGMILTTPSWQGLTRFGRVHTKRSLSVPGTVILDFRGQAKDKLPVVHDDLYYPDQDPVFDLNVGGILDAHSE